jgi:hypothetical protein
VPPMMAVKASTKPTMLSRSMCLLRIHGAHHAGKIENQGHPATAGDSGAGQPGEAAQQRAERLDHHLFAAMYAVDDEAIALAFHLGHHHVARFALRHGDAEPAVQVEHAQGLVAVQQHLPAF